ncbi:hypothetical protein Salat_2783200 [Sesamum alatum]|uniref:Uncharacterized protein n=1 Tax=Sesamum alatum TaxID=300844 RepID=A0AAE2C962_9LAMI|nr:hypothetical protein Salat_2783200 [Sesamum alatum]
MATDFETHLAEVILRWLELLVAKYCRRFATGVPPSRPDAFRALKASSPPFPPPLLLTPIARSSSHVSPLTGRVIYDRSIDCLAPPPPPGPCIVIMIADVRRSQLLLDLDTSRGGQGSFKPSLADPRGKWRFSPLAGLRRLIVARVA